MYVCIVPVATLQELAVEDMRHELDDEGRREFFEEQGEDGESGSRRRGGRYLLLTVLHALAGRRHLM